MPPSSSSSSARRFVSRGGEKLEHALESFGVGRAGRGLPRRRRLDRRLHRLPAAARRGARLRRRRRLRPAAPALAHDPRVMVIERRQRPRPALRAAAVPPRPRRRRRLLHLARRGAAPALACARAARRLALLLLVKPQFEAGRADGRQRRRRARRGGPPPGRFASSPVEAQGWGPDGCRVVGSCDSGLPGPKGNREVFLLLAAGLPPASTDELETIVGAAVGA